MFKITQQFDDTNQPVSKYTVTCYISSPNTHKNEELWCARNLTAIGVQQILKGRNNEELEDLDFAFTVVRSGHGPAILTSQGDLYPTALKKSKLGKKSVTFN